MPDHFIRFRRGWRCLSPAGEELPGFLTLPSPDLRERLNPLRIARSFQPPKMEKNIETLWLDLASVPGLISIELNGEPLCFERTTDQSVRIELSRELAAINRLEIQVDPGGILSGEWGRIALIIRREDQD